MKKLIRVRQPSWPDLEHELMEWFAQVRISASLHAIKLVLCIHIYTASIHHQHRADIHLGLISPKVLTCSDVLAQHLVCWR